MTPQEKAQELYAKMQSTIPFKGWSQAKECALIVVDEILQADMFMMTEEQEKFWEEVKQQINNL